jgi:hypothetical protein
MMCIVGPVDWFVLKWLGRQPWTWVTTTGWIGVVTFGAIYAGHLVKSGDLVFRTVTLLDESGGSRVASFDVAGIYSPQTRRYPLAVDPESWWWPASDSAFYGATALQFEIPCHQDYRGNRPEDLLINVWNLRLLQSQTYQSAAPLIEAKLALDGQRIKGTITNRGPVAVEKLRVRTRGGVALLNQTIEPGQSIEVAQKLDARDRTLTTMPSTTTDATAQWQWYQQQQQQGLQDRPRFPLLNGLADRRAARIDQMLADREDLAVVYAEFDGGNEDRIKLKQPEGDEPAKEAHVGAVRSVVALQ